jgi:hypothetical protein
VTHGANIKITDRQGKTALAYAIEGRFDEIAEILRQAGAK